MPVLWTWDNESQDRRRHFIKIIEKVGMVPGSIHNSMQIKILTASTLLTKAISKLILIMTLLALSYRITSVLQQYLC